MPMPIHRADMAASLHRRAQQLGRRRLAEVADRPHGDMESTAAVVTGVSGMLSSRVGRIA